MTFFSAAALTFVKFQAAELFSVENIPVVC